MSSSSSETSSDLAVLSSSEETSSETSSDFAVLSSATSSIGARIASSSSSSTNNQTKNVLSSNGTSSNDTSDDDSSDSGSSDSNSYNYANNGIDSNSESSKKTLKQQSHKQQTPVGKDLCMICYDELMNKVKLECDHEYCFSCIKGSIIQNGAECPLCRGKISSNYKNLIFKTPEKLCDKIEDVEIEGESVWIYSGKHNGWWYYDLKANTEVEQLYQLFKKKQLTTQNNEVSICGYLFSFDFDDMEQKNKQNGAIRHIKRLTEDELKNFQSKNLIKGICGIKV